MPLANVYFYVPAITVQTEQHDSSCTHVSLLAVEKVRSTIASQVQVVFNIVAAFQSRILNEK